MAALDAEELERFAEQVDRVDRIARALPAAVHSGGTGHANISVNAGGLGVWVAMTCCLVMLAVVIVGALWSAREFASYDAQLVELREEVKTTQTYLNAIYQIAPQLKPKEKKE